MSLSATTFKKLGEYYSGNLQQDQLPNSVQDVALSRLYPIIPSSRGQFHIEKLFYLVDKNPNEGCAAIRAFLDSGGDVNAYNEYGEPTFFGLFSTSVLRELHARGADFSLRNNKGRNFFGDLISRRLNSSVINDFPRKSLPIFAEFLRLEGKAETREDRENLMAMESAIPSVWPTSNRFWNKIWNKGISDTLKARLTTYPGLSFQIMLEDKNTWKSILEIYTTAYEQDILFVGLPCDARGRDYWFAKLYHSGAARVCDKTPPLFGILMLLDPLGREYLKTQIESRSMDPARRNVDGHNMLYYAVLSDSGAKFIAFLQNSLGLNTNDSSWYNSVKTEEQRHILTALEEATTPIEVGMLLTLFAENGYESLCYKDDSDVRNFISLKIEKVGLPHLLVLDHLA